MARGLEKWALVVAALGGASAVASPAALAAGERLYREGRLSSGAPVHALVEGDVPAEGSQLVCASCHGRSGMGSAEGRRWVAPIAAPFLQAPRTLRSRPRPPYTALTLARAIRDGVDSAGNRLDPMMPRYQLPDADVASLVAYLERLSARQSPGVDARGIHFATVVTPDAPAAERDAMLGLLQAFFREKTASARDMRVRHVRGWPDYFGDWQLHVWRLKGPPSTWERQLDAFQRSRPVFGLVSGIGREWAPVHRFCERNAIPCLLPNVDAPPAQAREGYYAMYFSGGTTLEAAVIAARLRGRGSTPRVLQVVERGREAQAGAGALAEALRGRGEVMRWDLEPRAAPTADQLQARIRSERATAVVLWLGPAALDTLMRKAPQLAPVEVFASSTLLGGRGEVPASLRGQAGQLVHPYALPSDQVLRYRRLESWLAGEHLASSPDVRRVQAQTFFAVTVLSEGMMHLHLNLLREYLLEGIDHFSGVQNFSPDYPHLTFGPGQRLLSKGCNLIPLEGSTRPEWVVP